MGTGNFYDFVRRRFIPADEEPTPNGTLEYLVKSSIPILPEEADLLHDLTPEGLLGKLDLDMGTF
jgi:hypothetical protein